MKGEPVFTFLVLVRGVCGYVIIIASLCVLHVYSGYGLELAVRLTNGLVPLFFLALGGILLDSFEWVILKLKRSN